MPLSRFLYLVAVVTSCSFELKVSHPILYAGTFTRDEGFVNGTGKGIYTFRFNTNTGSLTSWGVTLVGVNPIYIQGTKKKFSNGARAIYAVNSVADHVSVDPTRTTGYVSAFNLKEDGALEMLNTVETYGGYPTHISLSPDEDFVVVSNYAGSVAMFPVLSDGRLGNKSFLQEFPVGSHVVASRQEAGHIHSTTWIPDSKHVVAANLGSDELLQYEIEQELQTLKGLRTVKRPPGSGPRHMVVHHNQNYAYVVDELSNTVGVYNIDKKSALLVTNALQDIPTIPSDFKNYSASADIHLSDNGNFLYTSNRGHNSIAIFKIDKADGTLTSIGWESSRGENPRGFVIYDNWLIVANQDSKDMHVFKVDSTTGLLSYTGNSYEIDSAVCLYVAEF
ncbi:hypothetical protein PsorP6_008824 [Peronosclerospora sorghi]|uniref:Uncharacterized protein n=1 Tax=Peronosclerospora sorghi TaxID=230839 RepID=A0ACC0VZX6_9STRA|nr:hypothetical protein PsorP6_008824 [Peronosclerospora sorghi]